MKQLERYIREQSINEDMDDWWKESDFDDREVNYYCVEWTHEYNSLAGPQKEDNRYIFIIWDKKKLTDNQLAKLMKKWCMHLEKEDEKSLNDDYKEVKNGTLKKLYDLCTDSKRKNHWSGSIIDTKINQSVYWCFK